MKTKFEIGDKVAYSVQFLQSTGQYTGEIPAARGVITGLKNLGSTTLAEIDWGNDNIPPRVNTTNLAKVGLNTRFSAC